VQHVDHKNLGLRRVAGLLGALLALLLTTPQSASSQSDSVPAEGATSIAKAVGVIKSVQPDSITVAAESGRDIAAKLDANTKILRVPPGEKDLKNASPLRLQDLQPGDRVLVRGQNASGMQNISALTIIVMKQADVSAKQQHDREDWQKRGVGGLVTKVDVAMGLVAISSGGFGASTTVSVHISKDAVLRRYAPDSVKFDDAKRAPLDQIKVGDQLRARGTRSPDGADLAAEEVVSGTFRNIAGTITAINAADSSITVKDLIAKATVVVKVAADSQMKKLPAEMAQRIAVRLKGGAGAGGNGTGAQSAPGRDENRRGTESAGGRGQAGGQGANGSPDFQRLLGRLPSCGLADLQNGDAVMIVSTDGAGSGAVTAITLLAGVDAILTNRSSYSLLTPWSLNTSGGEGEPAP